jgi:peptidoglycan/LPS O-acetylase OafA/YrhL
MNGGYVGVDVFFVISGYLLSAIVFADVAASRFSIIDFYERRIRRIFPALFAMLIAFTVFAWIYFLPGMLIEYAKSLLASTTFASNFYFSMHSGYFDAADSSPLLHTWSLAVEEQFYILFPLVLVLIRRFFPSRLRIAVVVLFVASLAASAVMVYHDQVNAFYMIYTRAWELLLGTVLSLGMFPRLRSAWLRNVVTLLGIAMIAYSVYFYTQLTLFPGLSALLPCVGTALIIGVGDSGSSLVGVALSWRPVVFVGLISYSLYLWHWPVVILHRMGALLAMSDTLPSRFATLLTPSQYDKMLEIGLSFALATLCWRFVERPFRNGPLRLDGRPLFAMAGTVMFIFVAVSTVAIFANGFEGRFPSQAVQIASALNGADSQKAFRVGTCFITGAERFEDYNNELCLHRDPGKRNYLLLGDSHSAALWPGLSYPVPGVNIMQASSAGCAPFVDTSDALPVSDCRKMMRYIFNVFLPSHPVEGLLLGARWQSKDIGRLAETLEWARQHQLPVVLFGPVPEYDMPLPLLLAYSIAWNNPDLVSHHRIGERQSLDAQLEKLAANTWHVPYISLYQAVCQDRDCMVYSDAQHKIPLMGDDSHLSPAGSLVILRRLLDQGKIFAAREQTTLIGAKTNPAAEPPVAFAALATSGGL